ncbi:MAG: hypothetical protein Q7R35_13285 [Elusimicrobiota bacterium]|nr:hypothetical protein [Elusimicrobiota bacterium]
MKRLIVFFAVLLLPAFAGAYQYDARLSAKLKKEFEAQLRAVPAGRELYGRLEKAKGYSGLRVLIRRDPSPCFAWFDPVKNAVYFNSRFILKLFAAKGFKDSQVVEVLWGNKEVRAELVKYTNPIYLHELVHAVQCYLYPEYRQDAGANPLEFEYEAYLTEDIYVHERMKADPALLRSYIRGAYTDLYTDTIFASYFTLSLDMDRYKEKIRKYYEEQLGGYLSLEKAETIQKNREADSKIFAYAAGDSGNYAKTGVSLARLQKEKAEYAGFLEEFFEARWPPFSADALLFVGGMALAEKNYPLALDCLAVADVNAAKYELDPAVLNSLKTSGALVILEAASFIRDASKKMGIEVLSQHLKSLEKACAVTGRPFPEDLLELKGSAYPKAMAYYAKKHAAETDPARKDYYKENLDYFAASVKAAPGDE